jgi:predicted ribosomally synthesized peptide with nif11-like leader
MPIEQAKAFRDFVGKNEELQDSIEEQAAAGETIDWSALGAKHGFQFTQEDTEALAREMGWDGEGEGEMVEGEITDDDLAQVAGGAGARARKIRVRHSPISMAMGHNRRVSPFAKNDFAQFKGRFGK